LTSINSVSVPDFIFAPTISPLDRSTVDLVDGVEMARLIADWCAARPVWMVGTEAIHKDQPGGGDGVPVALYSSDGEKWDHSSNDPSSCKSQMCVDLHEFP